MPSPNEPDVMKSSVPDFRSVCLMIEPVIGETSLLWRGLAITGGTTVNAITGSDRAIVIEDCVDALDRAGVRGFAAEDESDAS